MEKNYKQVIHKNKDNWDVIIDQIQGTAEMLQDYLANKISQLIPYGITIEEYPFFKQQSVVNDEFKLRSLYRGQTYIRIPVLIEKTGDNRFQLKRVDGNLSVVNGYAIVDKREIKEAKRVNKKLDKEQIHNLALTEADSLIKGFNMVSNNEMYRCVIKHDGSVVRIIDFIPKKDTYDMLDYILDKLSIMNMTVDKLIKEAITEAFSK